MVPAVHGRATAMGCDDTPRPQPPEKEPLPETSLHAPIEKAKAVEAQIMQARDEQDATLEEQGG
jgi:hypothetical protein